LNTKNDGRPKQQAEERANSRPSPRHCRNTGFRSARSWTFIKHAMAANAEETRYKPTRFGSVGTSHHERTDRATGVDEMTRIREIAKNATDSAALLRKAVADPQAANASISNWVKERRIGKRSKLSTSIAEQRIYGRSMPRLKRPVPVSRQRFRGLSPTKLRNCEGNFPRHRRHQPQI